MYLKDYAKKYVQFQDNEIEVILKDSNTGEEEDKIIIWEGQFYMILSAIPPNEDGTYVALAYHQNIDRPWYERGLDYWIMDCLEDSFQQLKIVEDTLDNETIIICKDFSRIIEKAINNKKQVLIKIT